MLQLVALVAALFLAISPAHAADSIISISPAFADWLKPYIDSAVNALILAMVGLVCKWLKTHFDMNVDAKLRDGLTKALQNQAGSLIADGAVRVMENGKIDVHNGALKLAAQELMGILPEAAAHFELTPEFVASRIIDTIPQIAAGAALVAAKATAPAPEQKLP